MSNKEEQVFKTMMKFAPRLVSYGKAKCDLCGGLGDVNNGEVSAVTDAATGNKRYFYVCYDCLHKRMDTDNIYNIYPDEERKQWRALYKEVKKRRTTLNTYDELCLNCFITTNDIQCFGINDYLDCTNYPKNHDVYMTVEECVDQYEPKVTYSEFECQIAEFHTTIALRKCNNTGYGFKVCKGRGSMLCENCEYKRSE